MPNPYRDVQARMRRRRPAAGAAAWLLPLVAAGLAAPLAKPVLLGFLARGAVAPGMEVLGSRLGILLVAILSLSTYTALVRGPDRAVLDPHPVQARALLTALALRTAREQAALPAVAAVLLLPVGVEGSWLAWAGGVALAVGAWICGIGLGFAGALGGVWAAYSRSLARVLDLLRGANPRVQAALIYAPAAVLAVGGVAVSLAASGLRAALEGQPWGWLWLLLPPALGLLGWALAGPLAERQYVRATALLAEIDGLWAGVEQGEDGGAVYLSWLARDRPELTRALRQGWRRLRSWATGAWLLGLVGAFAGWTESADAPGRVLAVAGGAALLIASLPVRLADGDPGWLDLALGVQRREVGMARATTAWLYAQGAVLLPALALALRHGAGAGLKALLAVEILAAAGAGIAALAAAHRGGRGAWLYGPAALILWAVAVSAV